MSSFALVEVFRTFVWICSFQFLMVICIFVYIPPIKMVRTLWQLQKKKPKHFFVCMNWIHSKTFTEIKNSLIAFSFFERFSKSNVIRGAGWRQCSVMQPIFYVKQQMKNNVNYLFLRAINAPQSTNDTFIFMFIMRLFFCNFLSKHFYSFFYIFNWIEWEDSTYNNIWVTHLEHHIFEDLDTLRTMLSVYCWYVRCLTYIEYWILNTDEPVVYIEL